MDKKIFYFFIFLAFLIILYNLYSSCKEGFSNSDNLNSTFQGGDITHYWDCCKESCAWSDSPAQVNSCIKDGTDPEIRGDMQKNVCKPTLGNITTCAGSDNPASRYPWVEGDTLYGFVAGPNNGKGPCGSCYEIELENAGNDVKKAIVQQTSLGNVNGIFDFAVPGGGFGDFNGCSGMPGWTVYQPDGPCDPESDTSECTRYGGLHSLDQCKQVFGGDQNAEIACKNILFGVFPENSGGVPYRGNLKAKSYKSIDCPTKLTNITKAGSKPWVPPPPSEVCNGDCGYNTGGCNWVDEHGCNDSSKCGRDKCYTTCCNKKGKDCQSFCSSGDSPSDKPPTGGGGVHPSNKPPTGGGGVHPSNKPPTGGGGGTCKWGGSNPCKDGNAGGSWCNKESRCESACGGTWCP